MVETVTAEVRVTDTDEIATYNELTDRLWSVAIEDAAARTLLLRLTTE
jgi:hypothetical protein